VGVIGRGEQKPLSDNINLRMQCPEYEKLWAAYLEAAREWRDAVQTPSVSAYTAGSDSSTIPSLPVLVPQE
jgi:hypothetical protein